MTIHAGLRRHRGRPADAAAGAAREALLSEVLGLPRAFVGDDAWTPFCLFDADGRCVANVDAAILPLVADDAPMLAGAIRSVAVAPQWRGRGLFRALMVEALSWCDAQASEPVLLYTAESRLYETFGFRPVAQHAFCGPAPRMRASESMEPAHATPPGSVTSIVGRRVAVSRQAALMVGTDLFMANVAGDADLEVAYVGSLDAVIVLETSDDTLVIADIAAPAIPSLADLLATLGRAPKHIKTLFPPDRLGWQGEPVAEETGLMARGILPEAMTRPFMFPPTTEF